MNITRAINLKKYTTLKVGGDAEYFVSVSTQEELLEAVLYAKKTELPITILGGGSNVLVSDDGIKGLVVHIQLTGISQVVTDDAVLVTAQAGEALDAVVAYAVEKKLWGIENLSHIPGSVGATPVQNVGAYGVEVGDVIQSVTVFNCDTEAIEVLKRDVCNFAYRHSLFKTKEGKKYIIISVTFALQSIARPQLSYKDLQSYFIDNPQPSLEEIRRAVIIIRAGKFPDWHEVGTAGSFFKNPTVTVFELESLIEKYPTLPSYAVDANHVKLPLGWILDTVLHLKGYKNGFIETYQKQALVLVAHDGATATEIELFANAIIEKIKSETNILVDWEVTKLK